MIDYTNLQFIISLLVTLTVGGGLGSIVGFKYIKRKEEAKTKQEIENADNLELNNTKSIIQLYKSALDDLKLINKQNEDNYITKLHELELKIEEYKRNLDFANETLKSQEQTIKELSRNQLKQKLEIQQLILLSDNECNNCSWNSSCEKLKAKKITYEQTNEQTQSGTKSGRGLDTGSDPK